MKTLNYILYIPTFIVLVGLLLIDLVLRGISMILTYIIGFTLKSIREEFEPELEEELK